jgi:Protein kinase domain
MEGVSAALSSSDLVLGRYRPLRPLGSGSSGSVWLARDERSGLEVALKVVPKEGRAAERAEREAGVAGRLRHVRCQRVYEQASDQGHFYIAYEYVPGCTLREAIRGNRLTDRDAVEAAAQILEGLAYAHARGIVHRDVKPANVLLADEPGISVRLLDFGLARFAEAETLTAIGDVPGTLAYISPERLHGDAATAASDVWAVGVLLWEALAGRHPFWAASLPATAKKIETGAPPLETARPDLPKPLVTAVARAVDLDPAKRPPAGELAKRLRAAVTVVRQKRGSERTPRQLPVPSPPPARRLLPAALAALYAGWTAAAISFYPGGWPVALALIAGALTLARQRADLAFALAVPILPLGNTSLGLALLYSGLATAWFLFHLRESRAGLAFIAGPLLAPLGMIGVLPLLLLPVRGTARRALHGAVAVLAAGLAAGLRGSYLPFTGSSPPTLGLDATQSPFAALSDLLHALGGQSGLALEALILGLAAAVCPFVLRRGLWAITAFGAGLLAATLLAAPHASALALVATAWITTAVLVAQDRGWPALLGSRLRMRSATAAPGFE